MESLFVLSSIDCCHHDIQLKNLIYRGSYMSAHVSLNSLNELRKIDIFRIEFDTFNDTEARLLDSIYHMAYKLF